MEECSKERNMVGKDEHMTYLGTFLINIQAWGEGESLGILCIFLQKQLLVKRNNSLNSWKTLNCW